MDRPKVKKWKRPTHIDEYSTGPSFEAGHLVDVHSGWRTFKPVVDLDKCIGCLKCYLVCPDGAVIRTEKKIDFEYDFCKGCGVCAKICPVDAITMIKETK